MERKTRKVLCGKVEIGGGAAISIQSMTNTDTRDVGATVSQIFRLEEAGCQIVRCAVPDFEAVEALKDIKKVINLPLVADIHFDYRLAIEAMKNGADKIRINPGNIGDKDKVRKIVNVAKERTIPIRIGVNSGSLEKDILIKYGGITAEGMAESALRNIRDIEDMGFEDIVVSLKSSQVRLNYDANVLIAQQMSYPLHIGITEAGTIERGKVKSAAGISALLLAGIGDTIRVSFTGDPVSEVIFAKELLKAVGLRDEGINLISCPTCGRCSVDLVRFVDAIESKINTIKINKPFTAAIMGCEVNGPGEAKEADIGVAFGKGKAVLFKDGELMRTVPVFSAEKEFLKEIEKLIGSQ